MTGDYLPSRVLRTMLLAVALAALPHAEHVPAAVMLFFTAMLLWRVAVLWRPAWLPGSFGLSLATLLALALLYSQHSGEWGRDAGTRVFVVALGLKLLELNKQRDVYLASYLTLIVAAAQFLYLKSIAFCLLGLAICVLLAAAWIMVSHAASHFRQALRTGIVVMAQALPLAALLFVVFPRFQAPQWMMLQGDSHPVAGSGLSETLQPGAIDQLLLSPKLAFRVKFNGEPPPNNQLYWRGPVFSFTDGETWRMSQADYVVGFQDDIQFSGKRYDYTLLLEPQDHNWVYALDMPANYDVSLRRDANYQLISGIKPGEAAEFSLSAYPQYNTGYITKTEYRNNLQLPDQPSPEMQALVERLHGFEDKPGFFVDSVLDHFRQAGFSYTLQPPLLKGNRIEQFLFETKQGYCEHFATAFVYLMRVAAIPARVVSGYQGGQFNSVGQFFEIRQANAHAWAEVWLEGKGWVRVDPTAAVLPGRVEQPVNVPSQVATGSVSLIGSQLPGQVVEGAAPNQIGQIWDSVDYQWQRWIVRYGTEQQLKMLNLTGLKQIGAIVFWVVYAFAIVLALIIAWVLRSHRQPEDPAVALYRRFCAKLANAGVSIRTGEGAQTFAERAKQHWPEQAEPIDAITGSFLRLRYQRIANAEDMQILKTKVGKLKFKARTDR